MTTEELKINITVNSEEAERKLESLRSRITQIAALSQQGNFQHLGELSKSIKAMASSADKLSGVAQSLKAISEHASAFGHSLAGIKDTKDAFNGMSKSIKNAKAALEGAESAGAKGKGLFGSLGSMDISGVTGSIVSDFKRIGSAGAKVAQIPFKMLFAPMQGLATRVAGLTQGFGHLFHTIGRVAFMRAIRGAIRMVTQALKEGVGAVYDWAGAVGNGFVNTMNSITTSLTYFRNSIGAAISPILDAIAPVLDAVIDKCVAVINVFNQMIATLTGASTWRKAEKVATSFGGATNNAAKGANNANKAAKELKRTLLGFDEINRLDDQDSSGGSGGSGGGGGGGSSGSGALTFTNQPISDAVENFADMLRNAWDKGDFTEVGDLIGQKIGDALLSVPWDTKIKPAVSKLATSFGTLLNGLFDYKGKGGKKMWDGIAYTVYNALNTALIGYTDFFSSVHWEGIGEGVGSALKDVLMNINWTDGDNSVSAALAAFPNAVIAAFEGFCKEFTVEDFKTVGGKIGLSVAGALLKINWSGLFNGAFNIARRILNAINGALESFGSKWGEIKDAIKKGIEHVPTYKWSLLGRDIGKLIVNVAKFIGNVVDALVTAFETAEWGEIIDGITTGIAESIDWDKARKKIGGWIVDHLGTISLLLTFLLAKNVVLKGAAGVVSGLLGKLAGTALGAGAGAGAAASATGASYLSLFGAGLQLTIPLALLWVVSDVEADTKTLQSKEVNDIIEQMYPDPSKGWSQWRGSWTDNGFNTSKSGFGSEGFSLDRYKAAHGIGSYAEQKNKGTLSNARLMGMKDAGPFLKPTTPKPTLPKTQVPKKPAAITAPKIDASSAKFNPMSLDATLNITKTKDSLTEKQKTIGNGSINVQKANDNIKPADKSTKNWTAIYDFFTGKGVKGTTIPNFVADYAKKIGEGVKAFILKGNTAQYDNRTGAATKKFTLSKNTAQFDYIKTSFQKFINNFTAGITDKDTPNSSKTSFWTIAGFTASVALAVLGTIFMPKKAEGGIFKNGVWQPITAYASGGYPGANLSGQMFIAREAGPELVGTIGGATAVVNNDQIVASVSSGVAQAVSAVLGGQSSTPIEVIVKVDSEVLYRSVQKGERKANGRYGTAVAVG